jgi:hypothetical protein
MKYYMVMYKDLSDPDFEPKALQPCSTTRQAESVIQHQMLTVNRDLYYYIVEEERKISA